MSWLARSIAHTLHLDDEGDVAAASERIPDDWNLRLTLEDATPQEDRDVSVDNRVLSCSEGDAVFDRGENGDRGCDGDQSRGMKEDLMELGDSLKRQFWGVASFLAPPPTPPPPPRLSDCGSGFFEPVVEPNFSELDDGDFQENEKSEYHARESDQNLEEPNISESENSFNEIIRNAMGITEEVLAFASNIAHHPETWLDFPLSDEEEFDDFEISDAQYKHVLAIELLAPRLAALRIELCPIHMSEGYFWMVYFVLLHSRLNKHDAELLSSPQFVEARLRWMKELQKQTKELHNSFHIREKSDSPRDYSPFHHKTSASNEVENHPPSEIEDDYRLVTGSSHNVLGDIDDDDDWLKEDSDLVGYAPPSTFINEEDISFSDLEDDLDTTIPIKYRSASRDMNLNPKP